MPNRKRLQHNAAFIAVIAKDSGAQYAMIGGAPFFMAELEEALLSRGVIPLYAFSVRESVDVVNSDGSVTKTARFVHEGFITSIE